MGRMLTIVLFASMLSSTSFAVSAQQIPNFQTIENGLVRGGRPTEKDLVWLKNQGIETIVNLENDDRAVEKERETARKLGLNFVSHPMDVFEDPSDRDVNEILQLMNDPAGGVFVHCLHGRDRTGLVVGLHRVLNRDWSAKKAYNEMLDLGFRTYFWHLDDYFRERSGLRGRY